MRSRRRRQLGFSLLETLIALAVLVVGGLGTLQLLDMLSRSTGNVSAEAEALALARQLRQEMEMQQLTPLDFGAAWWANGNHNAPAANLRTVGDIANVVSSNNYHVEYQVQPWSPDINGDGIPDASGLDITITVDNAALPRIALTEHRLRLLRPVVISFRKEVQNSFAVTTNGAGALRW